MVLILTQYASKGYPNQENFNLKVFDPKAGRFALQRKKENPNLVLCQAKNQKMCVGIGGRRDVTFLCQISSTMTCSA